MSHTIQVTVGDTGITLAGTISGAGLSALSNLTGYTLTCSLLSLIGGTPLLDQADATMGALAAGTIPVWYKLSADDVASPGTWKVRWALVTPPNGETIHFPGPLDEQTFLQVNA